MRWIAPSCLALLAACGSDALHSTGELRPLSVIPAGGPPVPPPTPPPAHACEDDPNLGASCALGCATGTPRCANDGLACDAVVPEPPLDFPGFIDDPDELQMTADSTYNSARDEYLVVYTGAGAAWGARLSPCGEILEILTLASPPPPDDRVNQAAVGYNPDRDEYLLVFRNDQPQNIYGRYLGGDARPITGQFGIRTYPDQGGGASVHYNATQQRYLVRWGRGSQSAWYRMIAGDSGADEPALAPARKISNGMSSQVAYDSLTDRFLAVWSKQSDTANQSDVFARFISGDGEVMEDTFTIADHTRDETGAQIAFAPSSGRFVVTWKRKHTDANSFDVRGALLEPDGTRFETFILAQTEWWDVPKEIAYDPITDQFGATYFAAVSTYFRTVDPHTAALGETLQVSGGNAGTTSVSVRPVPGDSQFLVTWRRRYNRVYAGLVPAP